MTDTDKVSSVLASLTAEVMSDKTTAKRALTPVAGERAPALPTTKASFPNDMPQEVIEQKAFELTRIIGELTEARDALRVLVNAPEPEVVVDMAAKRKQKEFEADLSAKAKAAQAAYFAGVVQRDEAGIVIAGPAELVGTPLPGEWACPDHGKATVKTAASTGRQYRGCPDCKLFER